MVQNDAEENSYNYTVMELRLRTVYCSKVRKNELLKNIKCESAQLTKILSEKTFMSSLVTSSSGEHPFS